MKSDHVSHDGGDKKNKKTLANSINFGDELWENECRQTVKENE